MYKLEKNSPISNIKRNVKTFFPNTLWAGQTFLACLVAGTVGLIGVHHPSLQSTFQEAVGGYFCLLLPTTLATFGWTAKNFKKEMTRWMELGRQIEKKKEQKRIQERKMMAGFLTPEQLTMKQFTQHDRIVDINLFRDSDDTAGGRQEESGFTKTLRFPK